MTCKHPEGWTCGPECEAEPWCEICDTDQCECVKVNLMTESANERCPTCGSDSTRFKLCATHGNHVPLLQGDTKPCSKCFDPWHESAAPAAHQKCYDWNDWPKAGPSVRPEEEERKAFEAKYGKSPADATGYYAWHYRLEGWLARAAVTRTEGK